MAEESKKEITLEQAKRWRLILRIAFFLIAFVIPCIIIAVKFNIFSQGTKAKWSIAGVTMLVIVGWRFRKRLGEWINSWEDSNILKWILIGLGRVWPFILIVALVFVIHYEANEILSSVLFCLEWTAICETAAYLGLYPFEMKMDYVVKRMIRKNERKADYKEAIKEMKEETGEQV